MDPALHEAIERDDAMSVARLLEAGHHVDFIDETGETALTAACRLKARSVVDLLLSRGAHTDLFGVWPSPLVLAVESGDESIVRGLIDAGADVGSEPYHEDADLPLLSATMGAHWPIATLLIQAGAMQKIDPRWLNDVIENALKASGRGRSGTLAEIFSAMLERFGEKPLPIDARLLRKAASLLRRERKYKGLAELVSSRVDERQALVEEALQLLSEEQRADEALALVEKAPPALRSWLAGALLSDAITEGLDALFRRLLDLAEGDVDHRDQSGRTPLMWAAHAGNLDAVKELVARGADLHAISMDNSQSVLEWARLGGKTNVIEHLDRLIREAAIPIDAENDVMLGKLHGDSRRKEATSLAVEAASERRWERVEQLLAAGADLNGRGRGGRTILMYAAAEGNRTRVDELIARGADVTAKDDRGFSVNFHAASSGNDELFHHVLLMTLANRPDVDVKFGKFEACSLKLTRISEMGVLLYGVPDHWPASHRGELHISVKGEEKLRAADAAVAVRCPREISLMIRPMLATDEVIRLRETLGMPEG